MKIILGVTGGVAAYKAADIARRLMELNLAVTVAMTKNAESFITPLTFEALTGNKVLLAQMPSSGEEPMPHIVYPREADLMVIAPATANIIGKFANGIADDTLSTMLIASKLPVIMAPAMNTQMYRNQAVTENIEKLKERGVQFVGPTHGTLACGDEGEGKLSEIEDIVSAVAEALRLSRDLAGKKIIITAGGTRERVDAVRYIGNRSSGKMGIELAKAAVRRGARVTLICGAMEVAPPDGVDLVHALTADEMFQEVESRFDDSDALIMASAVGDYHVLNSSDKKVKTKKEWTLTLKPNRDILAVMGSRKQGQVVVGFAAETENCIENGRAKLIKKNMDMVVINDVSRKDIGFGSDYNEVTIITRDGQRISPGKGSKAEVADFILKKVADILSRGSDEAEATAG